MEWQNDKGDRLTESTKPMPSNLAVRDLEQTRNPIGKKKDFTISRKPRLLFVGPMLGKNPNWVPNPMETLAPYLEERGYSCLLTSRVENRYLRLIDIVRTILGKGQQYDIMCLQTYCGPSFVVEDIASWLTMRLDIPVVMVLHGGAMPDFMKRFPAWSKRVLARAKRIITPSTYLAGAITPYGFHAEVIPNLLPLEGCCFRLRKRVEPKLLWMRTFYDYYNPAMALRVLRELLYDYPHAHLTMAGQEKGMEDEMKKLVQRLGIAEHVSFPGFIEDGKKREFFETHDIFLNTTFVDNMPVCLIEAGAFGLPIVTTNVGGIPYMVEHERSALLVPPGDMAAMNAAIKRLLRDSTLAARLSWEGRKLAEQCSNERVVPMWMEVFDSFRG